MVNHLLSISSAESTVKYLLLLSTSNQVILNKIIYYGTILFFWNDYIPYLTFSLFFDDQTLMDYETI